jgi:hypothetical protein
MDATRTDDCLRPAIATAIQVPVEQVPDPRIDERQDAGDDPDVITRESWARIQEWLHKRGLQLVFHDTVPDRARWVGVIQGPEITADLIEDAGTEGLHYRDHAGCFNDHCVVMSYGEIFFDPAISFTAPPGLVGRPYVPSDIEYGISFEPKEQ